jgi:predicted nucleotidyltransferase
MAGDFPAQSGLEGLCGRLNRRWKSLDRSREHTASLRKILADSLERLVPDDTSFVTYGSIARQEFSLGSDADWTLLVDGQADPGHLTVAQAIAKELQAKRIDPPGPTATFGSVTFSHELVHNIGGQFDTNKNTTQRILLILESVVMGRPEAYRRVVRAVLSRYLDNDISFLTQSRSGQHYKVPRFLLNDIVRYWRTMCVDYATKFRERQGAEWALRNAKLRMSRKLIFASGLMICFSCFLQPPPALATELFETPQGFEPLIIHLQSFVGRPPTDIMADAFSNYTDDATAIRFFDAYDRFIEIVSDGTKREHLERLAAEHAQRDEVFKEIRRVADEFQFALNELFFNSKDGRLRELTTKYGMF